MGRAGCGHFNRGKDRLRTADPEPLGQEGRSGLWQAPGVSSEMAEPMKVLERENRELWWANEILRKASAYFALAELDRRSKGWRSSLMTIVVRMGQGRFATFCQSPLPPITSIWPSALWRLSHRAKRHKALCPQIQRVFDANWKVYGVRKVWRQLQHKGFDVARCTGAKLMKGMGLQGIIRGKPTKSTITDKKLPCPLDKVNRQFSREHTQ